MFTIKNSMFFMGNKYNSDISLICSLSALFQDRNDIPPVFTTVPHPVTLNDDVPIGTTVTTMIATDSDGTSPGNKVHTAILKIYLFIYLFIYVPIP
jgi:hypothetical protein